jgi:hypothetical protein
MKIVIHPAYYLAGIGVAATRFGVRALELSIPDNWSTQRSPILEPFEAWYSILSDSDFDERDLIEDYVTVCLAGVAGNFIRTESIRCPLKRSMGSAGFELAHLRWVWRGESSECDRAFAIAFSHLPEIDGGDVEATLYRLWHRAVRILREPSQRSQLDRLARELVKTGRMGGDVLEEFLKK